MKNRSLKIVDHQSDAYYDRAVCNLYQVKSITSESDPKRFIGVDTRIIGYVKVYNFSPKQKGPSVTRESLMSYSKLL
jgi:hypothetical protein